MKKSSGIAILAQSGGPTPVINASLLGVVEEARRYPEIGAVYGARFGIQGLLRDDLIDLTQESAATMESVGRTPSAALGTSRHELSEKELAGVLDSFRKYDVRFFFYNGGNGSMGIASEIHALARQNGHELRVIGIPKTIDNDLLGTDHSPGYASAARFFAHAVRDIGEDNRALPNQVEFVEVLGRNVGWLAAATTLARKSPDDAPHLTYYPEVPLPVEQLLEDVQRVYRRLGRCVVTVCEGQLNEAGQPFGADVRSGSRGSLAMNLGHRLAMLIAERLKIRARSEKPGLFARSSASFISQTDWEEARLCGRRAITAAIEGQTGKMVTLFRESSSPYRARTGLVDLETVAFAERPFPAEWRASSDDDLMPAFREYAAPLVGEIASPSRLQGFPVKRLSALH